MEGNEKEKKQEIVPPEGVSKERIAEILKLHDRDKVKIASLPLNDDEDKFLDVIICVPNRQVLGEYEKWMDVKPLKAKEILINSCLLSHKDEVKANDELFYSAVNAITEILPIRKAIIKNL